MNAQQKINIEALTFDEFDAYTDAVEHADLEFTLTSLDYMHWSIHKIGLGGSVHFQKGCQCTGTIAQWVTREHGYFVYLMRSATEGKVNGIPFSPRSVFFIPPGTELFITVDVPHEWLSVFIPVEMLPELGLDRGWPGFSCSHACVFENMTGAAIDLWSLVEEYLAYDGVEAENTQAPASNENFKAMLPGKLTQLLEGLRRPASFKKGRQPTVDWRLMSSMVAMIEDAICKDLSEGMVTLNDLVSIAGISERALRRSFQNYFGLPPRQYLQLRRLHHARRLLREGHNGENTVTAVAARLGMWDFGRFAIRYRRVFGERPSDTLRRSRGAFQTGLNGKTRGTIRNATA